MSFGIELLLHLVLVLVIVFLVIVYTTLESSPKYFVLVIGERASEASETLSGVYKFELVRYVYIYMYGGTYAIIVAHAMYT